MARKAAEHQKRVIHTNLSTQHRILEPGINILMIAGPNGAGKPTFAGEFLPNERNCPTFINADQIAAELDPHHPERVAMEAGRIMLRMIDRCVGSGESFTLETTLSGRNYARAIADCRARRYRVRLCFLRLPSAEMAVLCVRNRVQEGGHNIEEDVIRRRFDAGWRNFRSLYLDIVDEWILFDSGGRCPGLAEAGSEPKENGEDAFKARQELGTEYTLEAEAPAVDGSVRRVREQIAYAGTH